AMAASARSSAILGTRSSNGRAWIEQGTSSSLQIARARSILKPVRRPPASTKLNGGKSSVVTKRIPVTAPVAGRAVRTAGSWSVGSGACCATAPVTSTTDRAASARIARMSVLRAPSRKQEGDDQEDRAEGQRRVREV